MDLTTKYLGIELAHPLMPGASPLVDDLDRVKRLRDAGASAIVMRSLFEEQIVGEQVATFRATELPAESFPEALSYFPSPEEFVLGPDDYLEQIRRIKDLVGLPVIGSLNGVNLGVWIDYARQMVEAGASALELNVYELQTSPTESAAAIEARTLEVLAGVKEVVSVPVALKLSPFYTALPHFATQLATAGADGLVLFNRFYQPDIDIEELEVAQELHLSTSDDLLLRLRWLAILAGRVETSLAVSGGVHTAQDAIKAVMAGANAVQMVSALLQKGPEHLRTVLTDMKVWLELHEYESLEQMRGSMSLERSPNPKAYERANYMKMLQSWRD